ncbi:MAG: hypothetical protein KatS3mg038_3823 [Candidatus Kapaibacterium sp.]|nr:MAG: hypothetical protein KatS3mg038_3823 [Candidatus Kapabacteria bacterium]
MANEIRITLSMAVNNGALRETISEQLALDQASAQGPTPGFVVWSARRRNRYPSAT